MFQYFWPNLKAFTINLHINISFSFASALSGKLCLCMNTATWYASMFLITFLTLTLPASWQVGFKRLKISYYKCECDFERVFFTLSLRQIE